ncbi:hypothetical protein RHMOL_Rhmol03G0152500 [Rhododendron molle]|uniref:Uncharacterized protein n=1 Tax=Rhododendron molle TaxID=49168 RepID=A0ACC0PG45_RHOML|nr:hypothetical protein RHMOL_Rhmol03G0152500 [Rhododendron molle]
MVISGGGEVDVALMARCFRSSLCAEVRPAATPRSVPAAGFYIWEKPAWLNGEAGLWCFVRRWMLKVARV